MVLHTSMEEMEERNNGAEKNNGQKDRAEHEGQTKTGDRKGQKYKGRKWKRGKEICTEKKEDTEPGREIGKDAK